MQLAGLVKSSLIDYPGRVSAVVFTQGCNFRCGFCHNPELIPTGDSKGLNPLGFNPHEGLSEIEFFDFLSNREGKLDGVVITGGEPTIQEDLNKFIQKIKEYDFSIKLDTNGSNPELLNNLATQQLVDYIAMDIKGPLEKYTRIARFDNVENIQKSIEIIRSSGIPYEFRTTTMPAIHEILDFDTIGKMISGAERFALQNFRAGKTFDKTLENAERFSAEELETIAAIMRRYVKGVVVRENI